MKFKPNEIFKKYPDIEDIAIRLEESEREARDRNKNRGSGNESVSTGETGGKRIFQYCPEHAVISCFYKEGRWEQTPFTLKSGREPFLKDLAKILETRSPEAIKVEIFKGKTRKGNPVYSKDIYLSDGISSNDIPEHNELGTLVRKFDERLNETKNAPIDSGVQIELLRKDFEAQLKSQQYQSDLRELKQQHQSEINSLQGIIKQQEEYIEELEEELEDYEGELNGLQEEAQKEKETPFGEIILGRVLTQAGENILKQNPKILKIGLGLSDTDVKRIFEKSTPQLETGKSEDSSSFSETKGDGLEGLEAKHAEGIRDLLQFFKQIPTDEFKKLFVINGSMQNPKTGLLNTELAEKIIQLIGQETIKA